MKLLFFLILPVLALTANCNLQDAEIYRLKGSTFEQRFRALGGFWVGKRSFRERVMQSTGLSKTCAMCYAESYMCGKRECWASCITQGERCNQCLMHEGCIEGVRKCTGFK